MRHTGIEVDAAGVVRASLGSAASLALTDECGGDEEGDDGGLHCDEEEESGGFGGRRDREREERERKR